MSVFLPAIPNHKSQIAKLVELPPALERPAFPGKKAFRDWCQSENTNHVFLSMTIGVNENLRISKTNQAAKLLGYCADYDCPSDLDGVLEETNKLPKNRRPTFLQSTFSGGIRAFWLFEQPVPVAGNQHASEMLCMIEKEVNANWLARGLDPNSTRAELTFEGGGRWIYLESYLPQVLVETWALRILEKHNFKNDGDQVDIPLPVIRDALVERYPNAVWPGGWMAFDIGARGTRFWDGGDSISVIVRPEGLTCFTGDTAFYPWSKLLGTDWVRDTSGTLLTSVIRDFYFDSSNSRYMRKTKVGSFSPAAKDDVLMHLANLGLSRTKEDTEHVSSAERALILIQESKIIDGVLDMFFCKQDIVRIDGKTMLNVSKNPTPMQPAEFAGGYGEHFPWLAGYFSRMFGDDVFDQQQKILRWLQHFYQTALAGRVEYGLGLVLVGPSNTGKTFFAQTILGKIFGACGNCEKYMLGVDEFSSELVRCPVWEMSDPNLRGAREVARMGDFLKQVVANHKVKCRAMRAVGFDMPWHGRLVISLNDDPESLQSLPSFSNSAEDKLLALVLAQNQWVPVDDNQLNEELPHFLAWLLGANLTPVVEDDEIGDPNVGDQGEGHGAWDSGIRHHRFGMPAWVHPKAKEIAQENSGTDGLLEVLSYWSKAHFQESHMPGNDWWNDEDSLIISTSTLWSSLADHPSWGNVFRTMAMNPRNLGVSLSKLAAKFPQYIVRGPRSNVSARWVLFRKFSMAIEESEG